MRISHVNERMLTVPRVNYLYSVEDVRMEAAARRAARKVGLAVRKSRRLIPLDNLGGFALIDPLNNFIVSGEKFNLSAQDVIEHCKGLERSSIVTW